LFVNIFDKLVVRIKQMPLTL